MVSGAVAAPLVVPRLIHTDQPKGVIDTNTVIEMNCPNYTGALIFYSTDGSRPTARVSKTINTRTHRYNAAEGILLRQGKRTVKALCCLPDGRESNVVTKDFYVKWEPSESDEESDYEEEIARTIEASRAARKHSQPSQMTSSQMTTRTMSGRHSVGGSHLVKMSQVAPYTTRGMASEFDQYASTVPRVVNTVKMNATTGPVNQLKHNPLGERQFDAPPPPKLSGNLIRCSGCGRVNNTDARFCDWCGVVPGAAKVSWETVPFPMKPKKMETPRPVASMVCRNAQTQTVGLFYPGGKRVDAESHQALESLVRQSTALKAAKTVAAVSPGGGKWEAQLEHINHHLRAYAASNGAFRHTFAESRLGVISSARVIENEDDVDVVLTFPVHSVSGVKKKQINKKKSVAFGSTTFSPEETKTKVTKAAKKTKELPAEERILLSELSKKKCSLEKVEEVLQAGANPNCRDKDDLRAILLAVVNQHYKSAMLLISDPSLDLHWFEGDHNDTILHIIVRSGESPDSIKLLETLLHDKGLRQRENKDGETPADLAVKFGYKRMSVVLGVKQTVLNMDKVSSSSQSSSQRQITPPQSQTQSRRGSTNSRERIPSKSPTPKASTTRSTTNKSDTKSTTRSTNSRPGSARSSSQRSTYSTTSKTSSILDDF